MIRFLVDLFGAFHMLIAPVQVWHISQVHHLAQVTYLTVLLQVEVIKRLMKLQVKVER